MLILKQIIGYMLTHPYSEENEKSLNELYFDVWGKGKAAETLLELWQKGYFAIDLIPVDWIQDRIDDLVYEGQAWNDEDMNIEQIEVLEKLLKDWEEK